MSFYTNPSTLSHSCRFCSFKTATWSGETLRACHHRRSMEVPELMSYPRESTAFVTGELLRKGRRDRSTGVPDRAPDRRHEDKTSCRSRCSGPPDPHVCHRGDHAGAAALLSSLPQAEWMLADRGLRCRIVKIFI